MSSTREPPSAPAGLERALHEIAPGVVSAYVFGSFAEGRAHRDSDVDVGILLARQHRTPRERFEVPVRLSAQLAAKVRRDVDVVVLNDAAPQLARRIVTTGRRISCTDPEADHAFVRDIQLRAADLEPFLRRTRRIKLAAIAR